MKAKEKKLKEDIRSIVELTIDADWEWFENAITNYIELSGWRLKDDVDFDALNTMRLTEETLEDWIENFCY